MRGGSHHIYSCEYLRQYLTCVVTDFHLLCHLIMYTTCPRPAGYNAVLKEIALAFVRVVNEKRATLFRNRGEGTNSFLCLLLIYAAVQKHSAYAVHCSTSLSFGWLVCLVVFFTITFAFQLNSREVFGTMVIWDSRDNVSYISARRLFFLVFFCNYVSCEFDRFSA